jgi:glucosylceramidase
MKRGFLTAGLLCISASIFSQSPSAQKKAVYSAANKTVKVYVTEKGSNKRLAPTGTLTFTDNPQPQETDVAVFVDPSKTFQTMLGIGGALTDAVAETFYKLPKEKQKELLAAYYDKNKGIGFTLARTTIQSSDFSSSSYSYVKEGDAALNTFDISHDKKYRIPFIKEATAAAGGKLTMFVSPWSPPAFMKDKL